MSEARLVARFFFYSGNSVAGSRLPDASQPATSRAKAAKQAINSMASL
jgi:hypothetical protein